jgi:NitT/TauT family transport system substrate-binding protein
MKTAGYLQSDLDITKFVNTGIYKEALDQLRSREPQNATYIQLEKSFEQNDQ